MMNCIKNEMQFNQIAKVLLIVEQIGNNPKNFLTRIRWFLIKDTQKAYFVDIDVVTWSLKEDLVIIKETIENLIQVTGFYIIN